MTNRFSADPRLNVSGTPVPCREVDRWVLDHLHHLTTVIVDTSTDTMARSVEEKVNLLRKALADGSLRFVRVIVPGKVYTDAFAFPNTLVIRDALRRLMDRLETTAEVTLTEPDRAALCRLLDRRILTNAEEDALRKVKAAMDARRPQVFAGGF